MKPIFTYPTLQFRTFVALLVSVFITYFGAKTSFFNALLIPSFYYSVGGSFIIAVILINWVHYSVRVSDKKLQNFPVVLRKAISHGFFGFLLPCIIAYLLATLYFYVFGLDIRKTDYQRLDYPVIAGMLFLLNFYYFVCFLTGKDDEDNLNPNQTEATSGCKTAIEVQHHGEILELDAASEVACFFHTSELYKLKMFSGEVYTIKKSLKEIESSYSKTQFFKVSRNLIINFKAFEKYTQKRGDRALTIYLHRGLINDQDPLNEKMFLLDKNKVSDFKKWIDR